MGVAHERVQAKIRMKPDQTRQRRQQAFDAADDGVGTVKMIDDENLAARFAHASHLIDQSLRVRHYRHDVHRNYLVETVGCERHSLRVHHVQIDIIVATAAFQSYARTLQHFRRDIDPRYVHATRIERQRQTGTDADFEYPLSGAAMHAVDHRSASRLEQRAEIEIVKARVSAVGFFYGV